MAAKKKTAKKRSVKKTGTKRKPQAGVGTESGEDGAGGENLGAEILSMDQAIQLIKTTRPTFYRWLRQGKIQGMKVGRQWRFERAAIERFMKGEEPHIALTADIKPLIRALQERLRDLGSKDGAVRDKPKEGEEAVIQACNLMIVLGSELRASDMHLAPLEKSGPDDRVAAIRYRVDGLLQNPIELDLRLLLPLVTRWKSMAACDINERRLPQDGRILIKRHNRTLDLRVSFMPVIYGESVVMRLLDPDAVKLDLEAIDYAPEDRKRLLKALHEPCGMIVVTGPTGSGKTTNLYACLNALAGPERKTISLEEPVEYLLPWIDQVHINSNKGLTFARMMRTALRQAPNVIMMGEVRESESLAVCHQAALTGHLVMTTLHTEDAARALTRMVEMGSPPFVVADSVRLVTAQRLVRRVCKECAQKYKPEERELEQARHLIARAGGGVSLLPETLTRGKGCAKCARTGYRGRNIICETLDVTSEIRRAINRGATADEIRRLAVGEGMTTMVHDGVRKAADGKTTLTEVLRAVGHAY